MTGSLHLASQVCPSSGSLAMEEDPSAEVPCEGGGGDGTCSMWKLELFNALTSGDLEAVKELAAGRTIAEERFIISTVSYTTVQESVECLCAKRFELGLISPTDDDDVTLPSAWLRLGRCMCLTDEISEPGSRPASLSVLHAAIKSANPELVQYLLDDVKCSVNSTTTRTGSNSLHIAINTIGLVLASEHPLVPDCDEDALIAAVLKIVHLLVERGCDVNLRDCSRPGALLKGDTPLSLACSRHMATLERVDTLVGLGADVNLPASNGEPLLHRAVRMNHSSWAAALLRGGNCTDVNSVMRSSTSASMSFENFTPLHVAAMRANEDLARVLLEKGADPDIFCCDLTPLMWCANSGHTHIASLLIQHGCNVNLGNEHGYSSVHTAGWGGFTDLCKLLLDNGASHDDQTRDRNTQLSLACHGKHHDVVELLLQQPCNVNNADKDLDTPMHYAAFNGAAQTVSKLLECGAHPDPRNSVSATPLWNAVYGGHGEVVRMLLESGASVETRTRGIDQMAETVEVTHCYDQPKSLLFVACDKKAFDLVPLLVLVGVNLSREDWLVQGLHPPTLRSHAATLHWLADHLSRPPSLLRLCRTKLRSLMGCRLPECVSSLEIPRTLHGFLMLKEL